MSEMKLGAGTLYIGLPGDDEFVLLGEVADGGKALVEAYENHDAFAVQEIITNMKAEATFTVKASKQQIDNMVRIVYQIDKTVLDTMRESGHGRIAHLARRAKKRKTRKKNIHRAFRIAEMEG